VFGALARQQDCTGGLQRDRAQQDLFVIFQSRHSHSQPVFSPIVTNLSSQKKFLASCARTNGTIAHRWAWMSILQKKIQAPPKCLDKQTDLESGIVGALC
jgi:hypothetical protein